MRKLNNSFNTDQSVSDLIQEIDRQLESFEGDFIGLDLRQRVLCLVDILKNTRHLNIAVLRVSGITADNARERIRQYLIRNEGVVLDAIELEVVAGISEYGRRIRELRVQDGYKILTGSSNDPEMGLYLKPNQYLLIRTEPDITAARRWHVANRIRREKGTGAKDRILQYLQANVNQVVTSEELRYVAKVAEYGRRTRELRTEEGYAVATHFTGRPDLRSGEYVLESIERIAEPHDRHIPEEVQRKVYERDENTCRNCGWTHDRWTREDPRFLELHHFEHHVSGGENKEENLLVLCNRCHDEVHAGRLHIE